MYSSPKMTQEFFSNHMSRGHLLPLSPPYSYPIFMFCSPKVNHGSSQSLPGFCIGGDDFPRKLSSWSFTRERWEGKERKPVLTERLVCHTISVVCRGFSQNLSFLDETNFTIQILNSIKFVCYRNFRDRDPQVFHLASQCLIWWMQSWEVASLA